MRGDYKNRLIVPLSLILLLSIGSCTKRSNPLRVSYPEGTMWKTSITSGALQGNLLGDPEVRWVFVYTPPGYSDLEEARTKYPALFLLHGYGGNETTFRDIYNLKEIADDLINRGEIQPMIIVMPDGSNQLGGSFYSNSVVLPANLPYTGYYEDYIVDDLMAFVDTSFRVRFNKKGKDIVRGDSTYKWNRAISGHSMGGYGAFKIALDYDSLFSSVSAMSAPLTFRGDGTNFLGILEWTDGVFAENGITKGDSAGYRRMSPDAGPLSAKMFAMAAAFSPHSSFAKIDTTYRFLKELGTGYGVDIPIDWNGRVVDWIWQKWLQNDVQTQVLNLVGQGENPFEDMEIYFDCADLDELLLQYHAQIFHQTLQTLGINHTYREYPGYNNYPAGHHNFIYDRLAEILKFHSRSFPQPEE
jgi:S-formylglutathione hydrolase FrmB